VRWIAATYPGGYIDVCDILRSIVDELKPERSDTSKVKEPECVSIAWSADGQTLFGGFTDELVRVWSVIS
jgi:guanine nucleotide-binding protein subunit beta-2-like 1 protein